MTNDNIKPTIYFLYALKMCMRWQLFARICLRADNFFQNQEVDTAYAHSMLLYKVLLATQIGHSVPYLTAYTLLLEIADRINDFCYTDMNEM